MVEFIRTIFFSLWPFMCISTAAKILRRERERGNVRVVAEQNRILFMKYDELFKDLAPFERPRLTEVKVAGFALIDQDMRPVCLRAFPSIRRIIVGDQLVITLREGVEIWEKGSTLRDHFLQEEKR